MVIIKSNGQISMRAIQTFGHVDFFHWMAIKKYTRYLTHVVIEKTLGLYGFINVYYFPEK